MIANIVLLIASVLGFVLGIDSYVHYRKTKRVKWIFYSSFEFIMGIIFAAALMYAHRL